MQRLLRLLAKVTLFGGGAALILFVLWKALEAYLFTLVRM